MQMSILQLKNILKQNYLFIILAISAFVIHFAYLTYPNQTIFDEVYFGNLARHISATNIILTFIAAGKTYHRRLGMARKL